VRDQTKSGTGITFSAGLAAGHGISTSTRGSGSGVTLTAPLTIAHAAAATAQGARQRYLGVYTPPGYDPNRAQPYKTIYLQHGSGQDASDWLNMGDAPTLMDNLLQDGLTEPAVIVTTDQTYLGNSPYTFIESTVIPYVQSHYNVSTDRMDRAFAGLSAGGSTTVNIINNNPLRFGYFGVFDWTPSINTNTANLNQAYILVGFGHWDTTVFPPSQATINALAASPNLHFQYLDVAGAHDFNTWDQLLTKFMRDYLWKPSTFVYTPGKTAQLVNFGALSDKTFGDSDFGINATATSGLPVALTLTQGPCTVDSATSPANVHITGSGECTITASQAGNGSFDAAAAVVRTFQVAKANQTISFGPLADKAFGDADFGVSATASSGLGVSFDAVGDCTVTGSTVHITAAGSCTVKASQTGDDNWNPAPDVSEDFAIAKGEQTITFGALDGKTYGDADFAVSATASSSLDVSFAASGSCTVTGSTVHITGAGSCTVTASQAGDSNWKAAPDVSQTFAIAREDQTISFGAVPGKTYGAAEFAVSATASSGLDVSFAASGACTVTGSTVHISAVGSCTVTASQAGDDNWNPAPNVSQTFAVTYRYDGLQQPVNDTGHAQTCGANCTLSVFKAGSTVPVKFVLKDANGTVILASALPIWGTPVKLGPLSSPVDESVYTDPPTSGGTFVWDGSQYHYNWSTKGLQAGFTYRISVILDDGTIQTATVGLK